VHTVTSDIDRIKPSQSERRSIADPPIAEIKRFITAVVL